MRRLCVGQGLVWFKHLFRLMSGVTCSSTNRMTCLDWSSGSGSDEIEDGATLVQVRRLPRTENVSAFFPRSVIPSPCVCTHEMWKQSLARSCAG